MKPDFIIGGVMKSGTTFLTNLLINHPKVHIIKRDMDLAFFDDDRIYKKGEKWYQSLFKDYSELEDDAIVGQTSADCAFNPGSAERIMKYNPSTKLIFVLRHPIERAYSLYWHQYGMAREHHRFEEAISKESQRINKSYQKFKHYSYLERSKYKQQFEEIYKHIPREQLLILDFESLTKETKATVNIVLKYLGVSSIKDVEDLNYSKLPRNPSKIASSHLLVEMSSYLQKIGLVPVGRRLINRFRKEVRPPKMNQQTREKLEIILKEDIEYYEKIKTEFKVKLLQS